MVTADDQAADLAHECVKAISIQWLHALTPGQPCLILCSKAAPPLVPTAFPGRLEVEGDAEPKAGADLELQIG